MLDLFHNVILKKKRELSHFLIFGDCCGTSRSLQLPCSYKQKLLTGPIPEPLMSVNVQMYV